MSSKRVAYITGTRADFGLMESALKKINAAPGLEIQIIATGMHLSPHFGMTVRHVEASGLPVAARVDMLLSSDSGAGMGTGIGVGVVGLTQALRDLRPDAVLLLGDRGEMLAGAVAALHLNIPIAHVHGGDLSGTVDESVRHAVTKLSHLHFAVTEESAKRVRQLGEDPGRVFCVGAPGLDDILSRPIPDRGQIGEKFAIDDDPYMLIVQHPVHQELDSSEDQIEQTLSAAMEFDSRLLVCNSNADAGHGGISRALERLKAHARHKVLPNVERADYLSLMRHASLLVGNSSSGIIEAASLGVPVVNVGSRQHGRERNPNTLDVSNKKKEIAQAIEKALGDEQFRQRVAEKRNVYGDGKAGERIAKILSETALDSGLLNKEFHS